jgi:hypothetical protein
MPTVRIALGQRRDIVSGLSAERKYDENGKGGAGDWMKLHAALTLFLAKLVVCPIGW